jgi:hypothetical protein
VPDVPPTVLARLREIGRALPETYEEQAWAGIRWCVRRRTFAHVLRIESGRPPAYSRAAGTDGPATVLTFRSAGPELEVLGASGPPFFRPPWAPGLVGMLIGDGEGAGEATDWSEVAELLTESYCVLAPRRLVALVARPEG